MKIRAKIILVVLPIVIVTIILVGVSSYFSASAGINNLARDFLGFKVSELRKRTVSEWQILVDNDLTEDPAMIEATKSGLDSYARSISPGETEIIFAVTPSGDVAISSKELLPSEAERVVLAELHSARPTSLTTLTVGGIERVAKGFYFAPLDWYFLVTESSQAFFGDINAITRQTVIILIAASLAAALLMFWFAGLLTEPLKKIVVSMREIISSGDLTSLVDVEYNDETGTLAHTFNIMIAQLDKAQSRIKDFAFQAVWAKRQEHKIRKIFEKFVPANVINEFESRPEELLVGEDRVLGILFTDIRGFTTISEQMAPDELITELNRYFAIMVDLIIARSGIVDKYIGDAIMAFFGAPERHDDDAYQAALAGLEVCDAVDRFNEKQESRGYPAFATGVGVNYGIVTVGNIGSEKKMDYTVIGDSVNLASRLEGLTKNYGQKIIISEGMHYKVKDLLPCRLLDTVAVKGKKVGIKIYTVKRGLEAAEERAWETHHNAMDAYYGRRFREAVDLFTRANQQFGGNDVVAQKMLQRCRDFIDDPPPEAWDGVEIMKTK
jgi:adenylate cyclase